MTNNAFKTPNELGLMIAMNVRAHRKAQGISQKRLSEMSGVSHGSLKRFESTGEIAMKSLLKIAIVLDCTDAFSKLFASDAPRTIQEILDGNL